MAKRKQQQQERIGPFHKDGWLTAYEGDARAVMAGFPENSIHAIVTSPPYWGLRDYGLPASWWGGTERPSDHEHSGDEYCFCGAWHGQLGLEPTVEEYVAHLVEVLRAARRVLRDDGTLWLNLGDSYGGSRSGPSGDGLTGRDTEKGRRNDQWKTAGIRAKDLVGMPWRTAFALQADGWYLRSDVVWAKANPMPESVTDRPAKDHEYVFLLSKSPTYYYDVDAMRQTTPSQVGRKRGDSVGGPGWNGRQQHSPGGVVRNGGSHNLRDVWTIASQPYPASHFAVFPEELAVPPIRSGTSARGVCEKCGAPWRRDVERQPMVLRRSEQTHSKGQTRASGTMLTPPNAVTTGWSRGCEHANAAVTPSIVMDPFAGTGTVGIVARRYLRRAIMIDLDATYMKDRLVTRAEYDTAKGVTEEEWAKV